MEPGKLGSIFCFVEGLAGKGKYHQEKKKQFPPALF